MILLIFGTNRIMNQDSQYYVHPLTPSDLNVHNPTNLCDILGVLISLVKLLIVNMNILFI